MIFRYATYTPVKKGVPFSKLRQLLPEEIKKHLIHDERTLDDVCIDVAKNDIVQKIDKIFGIPKTRKIVKYISVEVTEEDISKFDYFIIRPYTIDYKKDFDAIYNNPQCNNPDCSFGSSLNGPYIIKNHKIIKHGIGHMYHPMLNEKYLMISEKLKNHFQNNDITGLEYEECQMRKNINRGSSIYFARVTGKGSSFAEDVVVNRWCCKKHHIPAEFYAFNKSYSGELLSKKDFQIIPNIKTKKKIYTYQMPLLVITKRTLGIMLKSKSRGILEKGFFYERSFEPLLLSVSSEK